MLISDARSAMRARPRSLAAAATRRGVREIAKAKRGVAAAAKLVTPARSKGSWFTRKFRWREIGRVNKSNMRSEPTKP